MNEPTNVLDQLAGELAERIARRLAQLQPEPHCTAPNDQVSLWLSVESAAAYLDWPKQRLYKLTASGAIPHYKQEGRLLFHRSELDRWLAGFAQAH